MQSRSATFSNRDTVSIHPNTWVSQKHSHCCFSENKLPSVRTGHSTTRHNTTLRSFVFMRTAEARCFIRLYTHCRCPTFHSSLCALPMPDVSFVFMRTAEARRFIRLYAHCRCFIQLYAHYRCPMFHSSSCTLPKPDVSLVFIRTTDARTFHSTLCALLKPDVSFVFMRTAEARQRFIRLYAHCRCPTFHSTLCALPKPDVSFVFMRTADARRFIRLYAHCRSPTTIHSTLYCRRSTSLTLVGRVAPVRSRSRRMSSTGVVYSRRGTSPSNGRPSCARPAVRSRSSTHRCQSTQTWAAASRPI